MNIFHNPDCWVDSYYAGTAAYVAPYNGFAMMEGPDSLMLYAHSDQNAAYTVQRVPDPEFAARRCWKVVVTNPAAQITGGEGCMLYWPIEGSEVVDLRPGTQDAVDLPIKIRLRMPAGWTICFQLISGPLEDRSYVVELTQPANKNNLWHLHEFTIPMDKTGTNWTCKEGQIGMFAVLTLAGGQPWKASAANAWVDGDKAFTDAQTNVMASYGNTLWIGKHTMGLDHEEPQSVSRDRQRCARYFRKSWDCETPVGTITRRGEQFTGFAAGGNSYPGGSIGGEPMCPVGLPSFTFYSPSTGANGKVVNGMSQDQDGLSTYPQTTLAPGDTTVEFFTAPSGNAIYDLNAQRGFTFHWTRNNRLRADGLRGTGT